MSMSGWSSKKPTETRRGFIHESTEQERYLSQLSRNWRMASRLRDEYSGHEYERRRPWFIKGRDCDCSIGRYDKLQYCLSRDNQRQQPVDNCYKPDDKRPGALESGDQWRRRRSGLQ